MPAEPKRCRQWIGADLQEAASGERALSGDPIWVNGWMDGFAEMPFGGMRESGIGRQQGRGAVEEFTKSILLHQGLREACWVPRLTD